VAEVEKASADSRSDGTDQRINERSDAARLRLLAEYSKPSSQRALHRNLQDYAGIRSKIIVETTRSILPMLNLRLQKAAP